LLPVTDGSILAGLSDAVLLVAAADYSTKRDVGRSLESLSRVSANVVGLVFNRASSSDSYVYYRYGYGYGYGSGPTEAAAPADPAAAATPPHGTNGARNGRTTRGARHAR